MSEFDKMYAESADVLDYWFGECGVATYIATSCDETPGLTAIINERNIEEEAGEQGGDRFRPRMAEITLRMARDCDTLPSPEVGATLRIEIDGKPDEEWAIQSVSFVTSSYLTVLAVHRGFMERTGGGFQRR